MLHVALPDPYAIVKVNGIWVASTAGIKKTLDPHWNEVFKLWVYSLTMEAKTFTYTFCSSVTKQSRIKVEIFDEKKQKKANTKDNGYLGGIHFQVGDVINIDPTSSL
jgi:Ca2+-dependent lipid-binding protein